MAQEAVSPGFIDIDERMSKSAESPLKVNLKRLARKKIAVIAIIFISIFYVAGITAPLLAKAGVIQSYTKQDLDLALENPSLSHPFGTDRLGRDQLARVVWSAQTTTIITIASLV